MPPDKAKVFGLSFVSISEEGLVPVVSTKLPFLPDDSQIEIFLLRYGTPLSMLAGQGDGFYTGLFGPYPVHGTNDWIAMTYSFFIMKMLVSDFM